MYASDEFSEKKYNKLNSNFGYDLYIYVCEASN